MFSLAADTVNPLGHVLDITLIGPDGVLADTGSTFLTMHMVTLFVATFIALFAMGAAAKSIATGPESAGHRRYVAKTRFGQVIEVIVLYMRDAVITPVLGKDMARRYLPLLLSIFFFILANNLLGLIPILDLNHILGAFAFGDKHWAVVGGTATGNIAVTAGLATIAFVIINIHGLRDLGVGGYLHHLLGGAPAFLAPIMVPIELAGILIKPVALAIRLFANMLAGHTLMATLGLFFVITVNTIKGDGDVTGAALAAGTVVGAVSLLGSIAIMFLEIFVAFLQAFIFMFLTTIFIGQLTHHHDDHGHEHEGAQAAH